jgi:outer membrane protein TolC
VRTLLTSLLIALPVFAQPLTEDEAVRIALATSPSLAAARLNAKAAGAQVSGAGRFNSPVLRLGVTDIASEFLDPDSKRNNIGIAWAPPRLGELDAQSAAARAVTAEADADAAIASLRLAAEVRVLFRTIGILDEQTQLANRALQLRQQILATVNEQIAAGLKSVLDRGLAEIAVEDARALPDQIAAARRLHALRLSQRLQRPVDSVAPSRLQTAVRYDRAALLAQAKSARPENAAAAAARCTAASSRLRAARYELFPWFSNFQVIRRTGRLELPGAWGVQASIELPVFKLRRNSIAQARFQLESCSTKALAQATAIQNEVEELLQRIDSAAAEINGPRRAAIELAERHLAAANDQLAAGLADRLEPALAATRVLAARQSYLNKLLELQTLEAGLRMAAGN